MHSSGMRTARLLPVSPSMHCSQGRWGGVPTWGCTCPGGCTCPWGVYLPGGVYLPRGCTCLEGCTCLGEGVYLPGVCTCPWGCSFPGACTCPWGCTYLPGGVPTQGEGVYLYERVYLPMGGVPAWGVYLPMGVYLPRGVPARGRGCTCPVGWEDGGVPAWRCAYQGEGGVPFK